MRELLGDELWELARPGCEPPDEPARPGPGLVEILSRSHAPRSSLMTIEELTAQAERILDEVERAVVGKREALELVLLGLLADGHVLIEDYPGLAKTLIARSFARSTGLDFARVQFTPDLMPSDVTGSSIYNQRTRRLRVPARADLRATCCSATRSTARRRRRRPRCSRRCRSGRSRSRADASARAAVHRARDAEPDRVRGHLSAARGAARPLPAADRRRLPGARRRVGDARAAARPRRGRGRARGGRRPATSCSRCSAAVEQVHVESASARYIVDLVAATRSARASRSARARAARSRCSSSRGAKAALAGRDFVTPDDVKAVAVPALAHRLMLRPELWVERLRSDDIVRELLDERPRLRRFSGPLRDDPGGERASCGPIPCLPASG